MIAKHGRKFALTSAGIVIASAMQAIALFRGGDLNAYFGFMGAVVLAFNGANATVSWAYARTESMAEDKEVVERRIADEHYERTP